MKQGVKENIFPPQTMFVYFIVLIWGLLSSNPTLTFFSLAILPLIINLLWRKGEPPIFVFTMFYQWIQASTKIFHANYMDKEMKYFQSYPETETAIYLSLIGVVVLSIGIRIVLNTVPIANINTFKEELSKVSISRLFVFYIASFFLSSAVELVLFSVPQLTQFLVAFKNIKWVIFFVLVIKILIENEKYYYLLAVAGLEIIGGITGYFSNFKDVFFYFFITFATIRYRFNMRTLIPVSLAVSVLFVLSIFWTAVKDEYRHYVNGGQGAQVVTVSQSQRIDKIIFLAKRFDQRYFDVALNALLKRLAYVDFFGASLSYVPRYVPHQDGGIWGAAFANIFMPRIFFPDKAILASDSEHTMKYTGIILASGDKGVSFSIGYMGDTYIDFGKWGMFVFIFGLGLLWGTLFKVFIKKSRYKTVGLGFAIITLMTTSQLEMASVKLLGTVIMSFLVFFALMHFAEKPFFKFLNPQQQDEEKT